MLNISNTQIFQNTPPALKLKKIQIKTKVVSEKRLLPSPEILQNTGLTLVYKVLY